MVFVRDLVIRIMIIMIIMMIMIILILIMIIIIIMIIVIMIMIMLIYLYRKKWSPLPLYAFLHSWKKTIQRDSPAHILRPNYIRLSCQGGIQCQECSNLTTDV